MEENFLHDIVTKSILSSLEDNDAPDILEAPVPDLESVAGKALRDRLNDRERSRWDLAGQAADEVLARASRRAA